MANYFNRNKTFINQNKNRPKMTADNSSIEESEDGYLTVEGKVVKVQTGSRFLVSVDIQGKTFDVNAYLTGKLKMHKIRIVQGDIVVLEVPVNDLMNGTNINGRIKQRKDANRMAQIESQSEKSTSGDNN
jgi:translation initiation factor IF-1